MSGRGRPGARPEEGTRFITPPKRVPGAPGLIRKMKTMREGAPTTQQGVKRPARGPGLGENPAAAPTPGRRPPACAAGPSVTRPRSCSPARRRPSPRAPATSCGTRATRPAASCSSTAWAGSTSWQSVEVRDGLRVILRVCDFLSGTGGPPVFPLGEPRAGRPCHKKLSHSEGASE